MQRTKFSFAVVPLMFVVHADSAVGAQRAPTLRAPALQLLSADSGYVTLDADRTVGVYTDGGVRLKVVDRAGRLRTLPLASGCRLVGGPHGREALLACGDDGLPAVIDLDTGATQQVANPNSPPPGPLRTNNGYDARDDFTAVGLHWLSGSRVCDQHIKSGADINCSVFLNRLTGERRAFRDFASRDLDDAELRSVRDPRRRAPTCRTLGPRATFVRGRGTVLVLIRCGSRPNTILTRSGYSSWTFQEDVVTWAAGDSIFAVDASTDRRVGFRFPGQQRASNPISEIVFGPFIYFTVIDPPGTDGRQTFNFSTYRAARPR